MDNSKGLMNTIRDDFITFSLQYITFIILIYNIKMIYDDFKYPY